MAKTSIAERERQTGREKERERKRERERGKETERERERERERESRDKTAREHIIRQARTVSRLALASTQEAPRPVAVSDLYLVRTWWSKGRECEFLIIANIRMGDVPLGRLTGTSWSLPGMLGHSHGADDQSVNPIHWYMLHDCLP